MCRKRRSAPMRTVSESKLRQLQMLQTGRYHFGSGILRLKGSLSSSYIVQDVLVSQR